jgi:sigma-B regulation protein RsbU (phosphoserine phosphatase)
MWPPILLGLLVACTVGFLLAHRRQRKQIAALKIALEKIELEESRVFDFLHGLGEAFSAESRRGDLPRLIVEGAITILNASGGALHMANLRRTALVATYLSKNAPPLIDPAPVAAHAGGSARSGASALEGYQRLHAIEPGEGLIGAAWRDAMPLLLAGEDARLAPLRCGDAVTDTLMLCPLAYASHNLGVLTMARRPGAGHFTVSDFAVFKAIAEQAAFALYNATVHAEAEEKKRLDSDIQVAKEIQRILLPSISPHLQNFEIAGINIPARHVSGDYFDYVRSDESTCGVAIADVSGKGVPASLIMAMCRSVLRSNAPGCTSPADVLRKVNRQLFPDIKEDMFISMAYVLLGDDNGAVSLCRAGHDAPLLYTARDHSVTPINPQGMALGIDSGDVFDRVTRDFPVPLESGDCLILYTDGVTEALDADGTEFGMQKVMHAIQASAAAGAPAIIRRLTDDLREFAGATPQNDDITLIAIRRK